MDISTRVFELADMRFKEQRDFANALGVSPTMVSAWRTGKSMSFNKRLPQIADILGTTTEYLLTGRKEPATVSSGRQAQRLAQILHDAGVDIERLSDGEVRKISKIIKAALDE